jgi:hypothetical protein
MGKWRLVCIPTYLGPCNCHRNTELFLFIGCPVHFSTFYSKKVSLLSLQNEVYSVEVTKSQAPKHMISKKPRKDCIIIWCPRHKRINIHRDPWVQGHLHLQALSNEKSWRNQWIEVFTRSRKLTQQGYRALTWLHETLWVSGSSFFQEFGEESCRLIRKYSLQTWLKFETHSSTQRAQHIPTNHQ